MSNESNNYIINFITVFISICTILFAGFTLFEEGNKFVFDNEKIKLISYVALVALIISVLINWNRVLAYFKKQISKIIILNEISFKYRKGFFEILDEKGDEVVYTEDCLIRRIKKDSLYKGIITCIGKIDNNIQTFNCYSSLNNKKNEITIVYGRRKKKQDYSIIDPKQLQYGYAVKMKKSFTNKEESWDTTSVHYTKLYDLKMSFPNERKPKYVDIFQIRKDKNGDSKLIPMPIDPLIIEKKNKVLVKIKLLHLKKGSSFRITWKW